MAVLRERPPISGSPSWESISRATTLRVFVTVPVVADGHVLGAVLVSRTPRNIVQTLYSKRHALLALAVVLIAAVAVLAWLRAIPWYGRRASWRRWPSAWRRATCAPSSRWLHR